VAMINYYYSAGMRIYQCILNLHRRVSSTITGSSVALLIITISDFIYHSSYPFNYYPKKFYYTTL